MPYQSGISRETEPMREREGERLILRNWLGGSWRLAGPESTGQEGRLGTQAELTLGS